jgi:proteasome lid subunit RPN8/RPN11
MPARHLIIARTHWNEMRAHVAALAPLEACGLVAGRNGTSSAVITVTNSLSSPNRFRMDAQEQFRAFEQVEAAGQALIAIFHSHPAGPAAPSPTDIAEAAYPVVNLIWTPVNGEWRARGFWIADNDYEEVTLEIAE